MIILTDYTGALLSFICTLLYTRNNIWAWPICILTNLVNLYLFYHTGIFADAALEFIYLSMACYGIWHWLYGGDNNQELEVNNTPLYEAYLILSVTFIAYYLTEYTLTNHTNSTIVKLDSLAMSLSLLGQWLMCRRYIETWLIWFVADSVLALMFFYKGLYAHMILNIIYLPITYYGYKTWLSFKQLKLKSSNITTTPIAPPSIR